MQPDTSIPTAAGQNLAGKSMPSGRVAEVVVLSDYLGNILGTDIPLTVDGVATIDSTQHTAVTGYLTAIVSALGDLNDALAGGTAESITVDVTGLDNLTGTDMQTIVEQIDAALTTINGTLTDHETRIAALEA